MEDVWRSLPGNKLSARIWNSYDEILAACADARNWPIADSDRIRTIGTRDRATVNVLDGPASDAEIFRFRIKHHDCAGRLLGVQLEFVR
jgi:hypothetical protein